MVILDGDGMVVFSFVGYVDAELVFARFGCRGI